MILQQAKQILKQYWGYPEFRGLQGDIISSVLSVNTPLDYSPLAAENPFAIKYLDWHWTVSLLLLVPYWH